MDLIWSSEEKSVTLLGMWEAVVKPWVLSSKEDSRPRMSEMETSMGCSV